MCQDLVDLVEVAEFRGDEVKAAQPLGIAPCPQELQHVQVHQVPALVPGGCLQEQHISITALAGQASWDPPLTQPPGHQDFGLCREAHGTGCLVEEERGALRG